MNKKEILVTGGSGFLGSHVADVLSDAGYKVSIFDKKHSPWLKKSQEMILGDISDEKLIQKAVKNKYAVFHFAALADLDVALDKPIETIEYNVLGMVKVLEACRKNNVNRFIFASSVYVNSKEGGFYRCSKLAAEQYIEEYHNRYELNYCILRYGSLYGPRSGPDTGLWTMLNHAIKTGEIMYMGHPESLREYIHVDDAAQASLLALESKFINQHIIITGQEPMRVLDILKMIGEILDIKKDIKFLDKDYTGHYVSTPYYHKNSVGMKYTPPLHVDLGQGILQMIDEINKSKELS